MWCYKAMSNRRLFIQTLSEGEQYKHLYQYCNLQCKMLLLRLDNQNRLINHLSARGKVLRSLPLASHTGNSYHNLGTTGIQIREVFREEEAKGRGKWFQPHIVHRRRPYQATGRAHIGSVHGPSPTQITLTGPITGPGTTITSPWLRSWHKVKRQVPNLDWK